MFSDSRPYLRRLGRSIGLIAFGALLIIASAIFQSLGSAQQANRVALVADLKGAIGPAGAKLVSDAINAATDRNAEVLVLRIDTPGGLVTSTREMIGSILAARVPIVGYVAPPGAHAASAGTYIVYATHVAAMAPGTNLGAATPVPLGGGLPGLPKRRDQSGKDKENSANDNTTDPTKDKALNDAAAFLRSLAELRGRNADWAEKAVREAASLSAREALKLDVIDFLANDVNDLLVKIDGRSVTVGSVQRTVATSELEVEHFDPGFVTTALGVLSNPNVALILMMIGVYGIIFEFASPGTVGPGVAGAIFLLLGLYALNQLPLDYAGLGLLVLGIAFMVAEAFTPTFGVLGFGGLVSFVVGAAMLVDTEVPQFQLSWSVIATMAIASGVILTLLVGYVWRAQRTAIATGRDELIGRRAEVVDWDGPAGHVWVHGERWDACGAIDIPPQTAVRIRGIEGLTLVVEAETNLSSVSKKRIQ
jgi:membrane-bound serine protease (ClpP class)